MEPIRFYNQKFSLFIAKFKKLGFSSPLTLSTALSIIRAYMELQHIFL